MAKKSSTEMTFERLMIFDLAFASAALIGVNVARHIIGLTGPGNAWMWGDAVPLGIIAIMAAVLGLLGLIVFFYINITGFVRRRRGLDVPKQPWWHHALLILYLALVNYTFTGHL